MQVFSLQAQVCGEQRAVSVDSDEYGYVIQTANGPVHARALSQAERIAHHDMGEFLRLAHRRGVPWGLYVRVGEIAAVYGEWPLLPGPTSPHRAETPVSKLRREWRESSGALGALENAVQIVRAYLHRRAAA